MTEIMLVKLINSLDEQSLKSGKENESNSILSKLGVGSAKPDSAKSTTSPKESAKEKVDSGLKGMSDKAFNKLNTGKGSDDSKKK